MIQPSASSEDNMVFIGCHLWLDLYCSKECGHTFTLQNFSTPAHRRHVVFNSKVIYTAQIRQGRKCVYSLCNPSEFSFMIVYDVVR